MSNFYMLCGLPAAGKTSWAFKQIKEDYPNRAVMSSDDIREFVIGDVNDQEHSFN